MHTAGRICPPVTHLPTGNRGRAARGAGRNVKTEFTTSRHHQSQSGIVQAHGRGDLGRYLGDDVGFRLNEGTRNLVEESDPAARVSPLAAMLTPRDEPIFSRRFTLRPGECDVIQALAYFACFFFFLK